MNFLLILGQSNEMTANRMKNTEIGLVTKMLQLPFDITRDLRKLLSSIGPKITASTIGAIGI